MILHIVAWYLLLGFVPVLLATVVEDFWERVLSGIEFVGQEGAHDLEDTVEFCHEPSSLPLLVLLWPLIVIMAFRLWRIRSDVAGIVAGCEQNEKLAHDIPGAALALDSGHLVSSCMMCKVDPRACRKLAVFHNTEDADKGDGHAMIFAMDPERSILVSETRRVAKRGDIFVVLEPAEENTGERFNREVLTGLMNGDPYVAMLHPGLPTKDEK